MIVIDALQNNHLIIDGSINFDNAVMLRNQGTSLLHEIHGSAVYIDLENVTRVDNVALSLFLAWIRDAKKMGKTVHFIHVPDSLNKMAQVYGVQFVLFP